MPKAGLEGGEAFNQIKDLNVIKRSVVKNMEVQTEMDMKTINHYEKTAKTMTPNSSKPPLDTRDQKFVHKGRNIRMGSINGNVRKQYELVSSGDEQTYQTQIVKIRNQGTNTERSKNAIIQTT